MKIAFLNISQGAVNRGAETFVQELSERLRKNHKVTIISDKRAPPGRWPILWRFFVDPHGLSIFWFTFKNLPIIWKEKFDVVIPLNGGWQPALVRLVTWLYGGKMVISGQSGKGWDDRNNLWCFPDVFVALSTQLVKWAKRVNPVVRVEYTPNGVDLDKFKVKGEKLKVGLEKPIILCVGALTPAKRIDLAIKAVANLEKGSLVVVGDGPLKDSITALGKQLLGKRFYLTKATYEQMPQIYRAADVFTLPSPWFRAFEVVLVEAMASGLGVVANDDPIRREVVGEAGILVNPTNLLQYTSILDQALNIDWGEKPRRQAEKFSWDKIVKQYEELFESLIK